MKYLKNISGHIPHAGLKNINIPLNGRNLIITGKNGSGKTSFLDFLNKKVEIHLNKEAQEKESLTKNIAYWKDKKDKSIKGSPDYSNAEKVLSDYYTKLKRIDEGLRLDLLEELVLINKYDDFKAISVYFRAMRTASIIKSTQSSSIENEKNNAITSLKNKQAFSFGSKLEQHLLNLKINRSLSITESSNSDLAKKIQDWFNSFDAHLQFLFENHNAKLIFFPKSYNFKISINNREFDFQNLSSGYLAIFDILADLLVRSEYLDIAPNEMEGIVIIDEIDAHLHISLQKKIMPFFNKLFPNIQFVVSTHSPFVITSANNDTVVYDISSGEFFEDDLSAYSYESLIKGLFHVNSISDKTEKNLKNLKNLLNQNPLNYDSIRSTIKDLIPLEKNGLLDKKVKNLYLQAINVLSDKNKLEGLDV